MAKPCLRSVLACLGLVTTSLLGAADRPAAASRAAAASDFTGDGRSDLLWRNGTTGQLFLSSGYGSTIQPEYPLDTGLTSDWQVIGSGDCDGDGTADILAWNGSTGEVYQILIKNGVAWSGSVIYREPDTAWRPQALADFTGDGKADLLWRHAGTGDLYLMPLDGAKVLPGTTFYRENRSDWQIVACADFDGDGKADILWWNSRSGEVFMMLMDGPAIKAQKTVYAEPDVRWMPVAVGDFDGDGKADLLWRNQATGAVYLMLLDGLSIKAQGTIYTEPNPDWQIMAVGDYDGDGKSDILWRNTSTGQVYQMLMDGLSISTQGFVYGLAGPAMGAAAPATRPSIALFQGLPARIAPGEASTLRVAFAGGQGRLTPGDLAVASGSSVTVQPLQDTSYTLTVTSSSGAVASYRTTVTVDQTAQRRFLPGPDLLTPVNQHTATLLLDGRILFAGGGVDGGLWDAAIYDPLGMPMPPLAGGNPPMGRRLGIGMGGPVLRVTGSMNSSRRGHSATLLSSGPDAGKVLVCGGSDFEDEVLASAELFDPASETWTPVGNMGTPRTEHFAALLKDGRVLIGGGTDFYNDTATAEIYDPATRSFSPVGAMGTPRSSACAVTLNDGRVLVCGGSFEEDWNASLASAECFDPAQNTFSPVADMAVPRIAASARLLWDGRVLLSGGLSSLNSISATQELFDPALGVWTPGPAMATPRFGHTATLLQDGQVLLAGGYAQDAATAAAEVFNPAKFNMTQVAPMAFPRGLHTATALGDGSVLVAGGNSGWWAEDGDFYASTEFFR